VLYHSSHPATKLFADIICQQIKALDHNWSMQDFRSKLPDLNHIDFIIIGAPAKISSITHNTLSVLKRIAGKGHTRIRVAYFNSCGGGDVSADKTVSDVSAIIDGTKKIGYMVFNKILECRLIEVHGRIAQSEMLKISSFVKEFIDSFTTNPDRRQDDQSSRPL
jgi:flavorubredoxin